MSGGLHLDFVLLPKFPKKSKTNIWRVQNKSGEQLGSVSWYSPWRRYTFKPYAGGIFDALCLHAIATFCSQQTDEQKKTWKTAKNSSGGDSSIPADTPST